MIDIEGKTTIRLRLNDPDKTVVTPVESHRLPNCAGADPCSINFTGHTHLIGIFIMAILGKSTLLPGSSESRRSVADVPGA